MTENEAIIREKISDFEMHYAEFDKYPQNIESDFVEAVSSLLQEIQQYRAIGTVESLKKLPAICDSLAESSMKAEKLIEELQAYRAIGTVEEIQSMKDQLLMVKDMCKDYYEIGTIDEFKALKEKSVAKKAYYKKMVYPSHKWKMEDGKIDVWAYEAGYCNGPVCERCYYSFCEHCNPNGYEGECVVEDYICPSCRENVGYKQTHCKCGQVLDWQ